MKRFIYRAILKDKDAGKVEGCIGKHEASEAMVDNGILMTLSLFKLNLHDRAG